MKHIKIFEEFKDREQNSNDISLKVEDGIFYIKTNGDYSEFSSITNLNPAQIKDIKHFLKVYKKDIFSRRLIKYLDILPKDIKESKPSIQRIKDSTLSIQNSQSDIIDDKDKTAEDLTIRMKDLLLNKKIVANEKDMVSFPFHIDGDGLLKFIVDDVKVIWDNKHRTYISFIYVPENSISGKISGNYHNIGYPQNACLLITSWIAFQITKKNDIEVDNLVYTIPVERAISQWYRD